jgi:hypothetical protein
LFSFRHRSPQAPIRRHVHISTDQITEPGSKVYLTRFLITCIPSTPMSFWLRPLSLSSACRKSVSRQYHRLPNVSPRRLPRLGARVVLGAAVGATAVFTISRLGPATVNADASDDTNGEDSGIRNTPLTSLLRSYFVFSICSVPAFVDWSPHVISFMTSIPGLKQLAEAFIRRSFFAQVRISLLCPQARWLITLPSVCRRRHRRRLYSTHPSAAERI